MQQANETVQPADAGPVKCRVRALDPERAAFEAWCVKRWRGDRNALGRNDDDHPKNPGEYTMGNIEFAWQAWRDARPKRAAVGRLINLAAEMAQHRPIRGLEALVERSGRTLGRRALEFTLEATEESITKMAHDIAGAVRAL
jgi:hypothetical protein